MPADDDRHVRRERAARGAASASTSSVSSACIAAMPTSAGRAVRMLLLERATEAEVGERDAVPGGLERGGDVFHAERLDAKERTQAEAFVAGNGPQQQHVHGRGANVA